MKKSNIFRPNYSITLTIFCGFVLIVVVGLMDQGEFNFPLEMYLVMVFGLAYFIVTESQITVRFIDDFLIITDGALKKHQIKLIDLKECKRVRASRLFRSEGSVLALYGNEGYLAEIREANYSIDTLQAFVTELKDKVPYIKLDPQYERLIDSQISDDQAFKQTPATYKEY